MNPFVSHLVDGLTLVAALQCLVALGVVVAGIWPAPVRPVREPNSIVPSFSVLTDLDAPSDPVDRTDIEFNLTARLQRHDRAAQAQVRRRAGLERQRTAALELVDAIDHQLRALTEAESAPTLVVVDEPAGGAR